MNEDSLAAEAAQEAVAAVFGSGKAKRPMIQSTAGGTRGSERVEALVLPINERGKLPATKDKYIIRENPHIVAWEREVRKFLRQLSPSHSHRVSAVMVYEWATGRDVAEMIRNNESTADLKWINKILRQYFGKSYMTYICGRKVPNAFKVPLGYFITRHRPHTLELYAEYCEGVLRP